VAAADVAAPPARCPRSLLSEPAVRRAAEPAVAQREVLQVSEQSPQPLAREEQDASVPLED